MGGHPHLGQAAGVAGGVAAIVVVARRSREAAWAGRAVGACSAGGGTREA